MAGTEKRVAQRAAVVVMSLVAGLLAAEPARAEHGFGAWPVGAAGGAPSDLARVVFDEMTPAQRLGQLLMVGTPASSTTASAAARAAITTSHVGNAFLAGRTTAGVTAVRALTDGLGALATPAATGGVPLLVAADQEGGAVQVVQGNGFSRMPAALVQGGWSDATLSANACTWATQMLRAGVNLDLAPVADTVPRALADTNPIGHYQREFGFTAAVVAAKAGAFAAGARRCGLATTAKHFPGLGHVSANTDTASGVTDTVTTRTSPDVVAFAATVRSGAQVVMVSSAVYRRIDAAGPAAFSPTVIGGVLQGDLGFAGVVVSDDLGAARQVQAWSPGARAVAFLAAGGDVVLTVDPLLAPAMTAAVTARAATDAAFRAKVDAAALRVLTLKASLGLLAPRPPRSSR